MTDENDTRFAAIINKPSVEDVVENCVNIVTDPHTSMRDRWLINEERDGNPNLSYSERNVDRCCIQCT
jgi:hypothetical protein